MLNQIEKFQLLEIAEQYIAESRNQHSSDSLEQEDTSNSSCIGCRKMNLSLQILAFVQDFDKS